MHQELINEDAMYVRKKLNKGGSYSVMLVTGERTPGKKNPTTRVIKNFGSSSDEHVLEKLISEATTYKNHLLLVSPKPKLLKIAADIDLHSCRSSNVGFGDVYGQCFDTIFHSALPLKPTAMKQLRDLSVMRIASPASKRKTAQLSLEYGIEMQVDSIYKLMDKLSDKLITQIKQAVYQHTTNLLEERKEVIDILFYDLTTISFETSSQDELRDFGFSKDGKHQHVQIMLAVSVTKNGLLVDYQEFPGNCYEGHTLLPVIDSMKSRYEIDKIVLVADAALMNKINLQELTQKNIQYVIAARIKNVKKETKDKVLDSSAYKHIYTVHDAQGAIQDDIKAQVISLPSGDSLIAYHSSKRARKDAYDREKDLERIKKYIHSTAKSKLTSRLKKPYVNIDKSCKIELDLEKLALDIQHDGFFALQTNIKQADPKELLSTYRGLWQIEQTFRIAKSHLEIRPVFHYSPQRVKAHLALCYIALALVRSVEFQLKSHAVALPYEQLHQLLSKMRMVEITNSKNERYEFLEDPPPELPMVYRALNINWRKKFTCRPLL